MAKQRVTILNGDDTQNFSLQMAEFIVKYVSFKGRTKLVSVLQVPCPLVDFRSVDFNNSLPYAEKGY